MSCEQMIQFPASTRPSPPDPYVFTEPPSIQTLQLHKSTVKGKSVHAIGVTPSPLKNRHNATESLKKKLGITGTSFMLAKSMAPLSTLSSPMISGRNGRVTKKAGTIAGSFIESAMTRVPNVVSNGSRRMEKKDGKAPQLEGKVPRKYTKRNENKKGPHMDVDLLQTPEDLWFEEKPCQVECTAPLHIRNWFVPEITSSSCLPAGPRNSLSLSVSREERLELKRCELRRKSIQLRGAQLHREILTARRRFLMVQSSLLQESDADGLKVGRNCWPKEFRICGVDACKNEALIFTAFCPQHITQSDEQQLFTPCTAKFADNKPCRVPVFDISHELPLCREHARKVENFGRAPPVQRSKKDMVAAIRTPRMTKISAKTATAPVYQQPSAIQKTTKRYANAASNMKLDYSPLLTVAADNAPKFHQRSNQTPAMFSRFGTPNRTAAVTASVNEPDDFVDELVDEEDEDSIGGGEEDSLLNNSSKQTYVVKRKNFKELKTVGVSGAAARLNQSDVLVVVSENSSAYESSEDTGVGGLSESEMIEEIGFDSRFLEDPEFNNVLEDLLAVEQHSEMFDAISDDDVKTMEINGTSTFLGDFLADQMLKESDTGHANHIFAPNGTTPALQLHRYAQSGIGSDSLSTALLQT